MSESMVIEWCAKVCDRAYPHTDEVFGFVQHNCPYRFGVDYQAATINGKQMCKHLKRRRDA